MGRRAGARAGLTGRGPCPRKGGTRKSGPRNESDPPTWLWVSTTRDRPSTLVLVPRARAGVASTCRLLEGHSREGSSPEEAVVLRQAVFARAWRSSCGEASRHDKMPRRQQEARHRCAQRDSVVGARPRGRPTTRVVRPESAASSPEDQASPPRRFASSRTDGAALATGTGAPTQKHPGGEASLAKQDYPCGGTPHRAESQERRPPGDGGSDPSGRREPARRGVVAGSAPKESASAPTNNGKGRSATGNATDRGKPVTRTTPRRLGRRGVSGAPEVFPPTPTERSATVSRLPP
jgi:hypothetical protein